MIFHGPVGHTGTLENALSADVTLPNDYSLMISTTSEEPGDGEARATQHADEQVHRRAAGRDVDQ